MKHIFVIDDDLPIGNLLEEALTREGYRVSRAYSGTEALLALSRRGCCWWTRLSRTWCFWT